MARGTTFLPATPSLGPLPITRYDRSRSAHEQIEARSRRSILFIELYGLEPQPSGIDETYFR